MAAFRNGIKTVIIPRDNEKDLEEIDQTVRRSLQFILADQAEQVLGAALSVPTAKAEAETMNSLSAVRGRSSRLRQ